METISSLQVTLVFVAIFALLQAPMTIAVGLRRIKTNIMFLDGGDQVLTRRMRAHGNFTETVPIVLLAMGGAEISGAPHMLLWIVGGGFVAGRLMHYGTVVTSGDGIGRAIGMVLTLAPLLIFSGYVLARFAGL
jgi:uncharacterized membrane protein YecN with MAPEG domain